jgi:NAD(P)-dependent dehydrogenase (short-subunit alcohol dehydrogenase family)
MDARQPKDLQGQHVLVTGAARGIGAAIVRAFAERGAHVSLLGRSAASLAPLVAEDTAKRVAVTADVGQADQVAAAFAQARQRFGPITVLVNNAGQAKSAPFGKTDEAAWRQMLDVNLMGTVLCTQAALPDMLQAKAGRIVNVASTAGLTGYAYVTAYAAAKHAVIGLTRSLALEVARHGITVNAVCPGYTETDILRESIANVMAKTGRSEAEARAQFSAGNPQGRFVQPEEVADAVLWLSSAGAASVNGQSIAVCGGELPR